MTASRYVIFVHEHGEWRELERFDGLDRKDEALRRARDMYLLKESLQAIVVKEQMLDPSGKVATSRVILERARVSPLPPLPSTVEMPEVDAPEIAKPPQSPLLDPPGPARPRPASLVSDDDAQSVAPTVATRDASASGTPTVASRLAVAASATGDLAASGGRWLVMAFLIVAIALGLSLLGLWMDDSPRMRFLTALVPATASVVGGYFGFVRVLVPAWRRRRLGLALLRDRAKEVFGYFAEYPAGLGRALSQALASDHVARMARLAAAIPALLGSAVTVWLGYLLYGAVMRHIELGDIEAQALPLGVLGAMTLSCLIVAIWFWRLMAPERPASASASALAKVEGKDLAAMLAAGPLTDGAMFKDAKDTLLFVHEMLMRHAQASPGARWDDQRRQTLFAYVVGVVELHCGDERRSTAHTAVVLARVLGNLGHAPAVIAGFMAALPQLPTRPPLQRAYDAGRRAAATWKRAKGEISGDLVEAFGRSFK